MPLRAPAAESPPRLALPTEDVLAALIDQVIHLSGAREGAIGRQQAVAAAEAVHAQQGIAAGLHEGGQLGAEGGKGGVGAQKGSHGLLHVLQPGHCLWAAAQAPAHLSQQLPAQ